MSAPHQPSGERSVTAGSISGVVATGDHTHILTLRLGEAAIPQPAQVAPSALWRLGHTLSPQFVGRAETMAQLRDTLVGGGPGLVGQCVVGLGGVGKSEVAAQYAHAHRDQYPTGVWWITADTKAALSTGLAELARRLSPIWSAMPDEFAAAWAVGWLQHWPGWLLVLDNAVDPTVLTTLLNELSGAVGGHLLVTSRRDIDWEDVGLQPIRLGTLDPAAATGFLLSRCGQEDEAVAAVVAAEFGYLPLALAQAAAYVRRHVIPLDRYLSQLREQPDRLYAAVAPTHSAERAIARVWDLTLAALLAEDVGAVRLLEVLAWLAPQDIPRDLLDTLVVDQGTADQLIGLLSSYSMVEVTGDAVSVHQLVQAVVRAGDPESGYFAPEGAAYEMAIRLLIQSLPAEPVRDTGVWPRWRRLVPHLLALVEYIPADAEPDARVGLLLNEISVFELTQGNADQAVAMGLRAAAITEAVEGPGHPHVAVRLSNLASAYHRLGDLDRAAELEQRAVQITEDAQGAEHPDLIIRLSNLGTIALGRDHYVEALALQLRALAIAEAAAEPDSFLLSRTLLNINDCYRAMGRPREALAAANRALALTSDLQLPEVPAAGGSRAGTEQALPEAITALEVIERALGPEHPDVAARLGALASTYRALGRPAEALPLELRALAIAEHTLQPDNPELPTRLDQLAVTYSQLGRPADALPLLERAVGIVESASGGAMPARAEMLGNLAAVKFELGHIAEATTLMERVVAATEAALGPDHQQLSTLLNNLGTAYRRQGRTAEALIIHRRSLRIVEAVLGPDHPEVAIALGHVASDHWDNGDLDEVLSHQHRALRITRAALGPDDRRVAECLEALAVSYREQRRPDVATRLAERALRIREATLGPEDPSIARLLIALAIEYSVAGDSRRALATFERAIRIIENTSGPDHADVADPLGCAAETYRVLGMADKAMAAAQRALAIADRTQPPDNGTSVQMRKLIAAVLQHRPAGTGSTAVPASRPNCPGDAARSRRSS